MVALIAAVAGRLTRGPAHQLSRGVYYVALGAWAYGEVTDGVNWFRRLLGAGVAVYLVVTLVAALWT
jgi:hypothetical protein